MLSPVQYAIPDGVRPQCSQPFVNVTVLVDFRQKESPVVVCWSTSPFASFGCAHSIGSPIVAQSCSLRVANPNVNRGHSPGPQNGAACVDAGVDHPSTRTAV